MEEKKKYDILTDEKNTLTYNGRVLHRIIALKDFSDVKKGSIGGFVESGKNLSQKDDCWIYNDAMVMDDACVYDNAKVFDQCIVKGHAKLHENAKMSYRAVISENVDVHGSAKIVDRAFLSGYIEVKDCARIGGFVSLDNFYDIVIDKNAYIFNSMDCITVNYAYYFSHFTLTAFRCNDGSIRVTTPNFQGSLKDFSIYNFHHIFTDYKGYKQNKYLIKFINSHFKIH